MACSNTCGTTLVSTWSNCVPLIRKNTAKRLVAYACDYTFTDILDSAEWETQIGLGKAFYSPEGTIEKGAGSPTYVQMTASKSAITNVENTVNFKSYDSSATNADYDFFNAVQNNALKWVIGYLDTEDNLFILPDADVFAAQVAEESSPTATRMWQLAIRYNSISEIKPVIVPGLSDAIDALA